MHDRDNAAHLGVAAYTILENLFNTLVEKGVLDENEVDLTLMAAQTQLSASALSNAENDKVAEFIQRRRSGTKWRRRSPFPK
jgi:hypothetical protein